MDSKKRKFEEPKSLVKLSASVLTQNRIYKDFHCRVTTNLLPSAYIHFPPDLGRDIPVLAINQPLRIHFILPVEMIYEILNRTFTRFNTELTIRYNDRYNPVIYGPFPTPWQINNSENQNKKCSIVIISIDYEFKKEVVFLFTDRNVNEQSLIYVSLDDIKNGMYSTFGLSKRSITTSDLLSMVDATLGKDSVS
jgi:hypothetical protein